MIPPNTNSEREQIEQAIAAQESLRGQVDDAIIEASIATLKEKLAALDSPPEQQRKLATILFMDIAGHTALTHDLDPEEQMALVDPLITRLAKKVNEFGGHVARYQGDGFKTVFGLPVARENDPEQAIRAGLAIQAEAEDIATELETEHGLSGFQVRVGITTGQVFAGGETEGKDTIKGPPVNLAARLESAAEPGTVLISYDTYKHVRGIFDLEPLDPIQAKGFTEPVRVYQVLRAKPRAFYRGMGVVEGVETRMIGREAELETLEDAYYTMIEDRQLQIITVVGEAGLGKSRLLYEFENWVDLQAEDVLLYRGRARQELQHLLYGLLRDLFAFRVGIQDDDPVVTAREKVVIGFQAIAGTEEQTEMQAHVVGHLLGYDFGQSTYIQAIGNDAQQLHDRSLVYLVEYFKAAATQEPVLILLEDLHWADNSSLDVLSRLALALGEQAVMIVGVARPSFYERRSHWFQGQAFHKRLDLRPLSRKDSRLLVAEVLQKVDHLTSDLQELVVTSSEGNPFYLEELVKMLVEEGTIVKGEEHWRIRLDKLAEVRVPPTLTGVLQARLERLPKMEHVLIKQASVVGRVFWDQAISYLNQDGVDDLLDEQVRSGLTVLREKEMIYRREQSAFSVTQEFIFKHAMLREVVYESVLKRLRRKYHILVADWLVAQSGERAGEFSGLIAQHLVLAGRNKEALVYLRKAGDDAVTKFANQDALDYYSKALELTPPEALTSRFELLAVRAGVSNLMAQREEQRADINAMLQLAEMLDKDAYRCDACLMLADYYLITEPFKVRDQALHVVEMAQAMGDQIREAHALKRMASLDGRHILHRQECINYFKRAAEIFEVADLYLEAADCLLWLSGLTGGDWKHASGRSGAEQALIWCQEAGDLRQEAICLRRVAGEHLDQNRDSEAQSFAEESLALHRELGDRTEECKTLLFLGNMMVEKPEIAEHYLRQSLAVAEEVGAAMIIVYAADGLWKFRYNPRGAYQECLELCDTYIQKTNSSGHVWAHGYFIALKSITMADLGLLKAARERQISFLSSPEKQDDQISDGWGFLDLARSEIELGEYESAQKYLQAAIELGQKTGYSLFVGRSLAFQAYAILLGGDSTAMQDGLDLANQAVNLFRGEDLRDYNGKLWYGEALKTQASLQLLLGNLNEALEASQEVLTLLETPPILPKPHEIHYIHSCVLTALGQESEGDEYLKRAYTWVMHVASKNLTDVKLRQSWLENVRTNREIVRLWEEKGE